MTTERVAKLPIAIDESPRDFISRIGTPERLPFRDLLEAARSRERLGQPAHLHWLELHRRIAYPLALVAALVLAVVIALRLGRAPSIGASIGFGSLAGLGLWFIDEISLSLGSTGAMPPWFAADLMPLIAIIAATLGWIWAERRGLRIH